EPASRVQGGIPPISAFFPSAGDEKPWRSSRRTRISMMEQALLQRWWAVQPKRGLARDKSHTGTGLLQQDGDIDGRPTTTQDHDVPAPECREIRVLGAVRDEAPGKPLD